MSSCHIRQQWSLPDRSDMSDMSDRLQSQGDLGKSYFILYKDQNITAGLDSLHVSVATWWFAALRISTYISSYLIPVKLIPYFPFRWTKFVFYIERNAACFDHINRVREMSDHPGDVNKCDHCDGTFLSWTKYPSQSELRSVPPLYYWPGPTQWCRVPDHLFATSREWTTLFVHHFIFYC